VKKILKECFSYPEIFFAEEMKARMGEFYRYRSWGLPDYIKNKDHSAMSE